MFDFENSRRSRCWIAALPVGFALNNDNLYIATFERVYFSGCNAGHGH